MTKFQKKIAIIGVIVTVISSIAIPLIIKLLPDKQIIKIDKGIMIEQRAMIGGGAGNITISKDITVRTNTNR